MPRAMRLLRQQYRLSIASHYLASMTDSLVMLHRCCWQISEMLWLLIVLILLEDGVCEDAGDINSGN